MLFDQQTFAAVLSSQSETVRDAVYNGNIIAVFDDSNENYGYEKAMGLPVGFEEESDSLESTHDVIGYIYQADSLGGIHITRVNAGKNTILNGESSDAFANELLCYEKRSPDVMTKSDSGPDTEFLGSVADYYLHSDEKKGDVRVVYEISAAQEIDHYDYYVVHAYIDIASGRALYDNGYDAACLQTGLSSTSPEAVLYKTGPNTLAETARRFIIRL